jgi:hypothetical protein
LTSCGEDCEAATISCHHHWLLHANTTVISEARENLTGFMSSGGYHRRLLYLAFVNRNRLYHATISFAILHIVKTQHQVASFEDLRVAATPDRQSDSQLAGMQSANPRHRYLPLLIASQNHLTTLG